MELAVQVPRAGYAMVMADKDEKRVNPDPPRAPGTPELPDLDVDPTQFVDGQPRPCPPVNVDEPPD
jgi:hypothetical protein